jgi:hypothetical protein
MQAHTHDLSAPVAQSYIKVAKNFLGFFLAQALSKLDGVQKIKKSQWV